MLFDANKNQRWHIIVTDSSLPVSHEIQQSTQKWASTTKILRREWHFFTNSYKKSSSKNFSYKLKIFKIFSCQISQEKLYTLTLIRDNTYLILIVWGNNVTNSLNIKVILTYKLWSCKVIFFFFSSRIKFRYFCLLMNAYWNFLD